MVITCYFIIMGKIDNLIEFHFEIQQYTYPAEDNLSR